MNCSKQTLSMTTRDGVRLDADIYVPEADGPFPVLLMRQPYGRAIASTVVYAHPTWYAAHGYIVVIQDVRGRGTSEGTFDLFAHEVEDGYDSVEWAAQLPGSNGHVGMYGFSYQGMTQLYAAQAQPDALKALAPAMVGYDLYHDWAYENGALRLQAGLGWAIQLATETARIKKDEAAFQALYAASRNLPLNGSTPSYPNVIKRYAPDSFWHDWLAHPSNDAYWQSLKPNLSEVDLPMLHVGGWFDPYLTGNLRLYQEMITRSYYPQHLWIGPWSHIPWSRKVGSIDFGPASVNSIDQLQLRWFNHFLKGQENDLSGVPSVHLFEMGTNHWRSFDTWPQSKTWPLYLASSGLAGIREDDGRLVNPSQLPAEPSQLSDIFVHDPWRPVPALGGHASFPPGAFDRSHIDGRSDVLTYTTEPLEADLCVSGEVNVTLHCYADTTSYDLCAVLSGGQPDGAIYNLTQGYCRVEQHRDPSNSVRIALQPTCFCLKARQILRLSISAACFPAYPVNPGSGTQSGEARLMENQIITITVHTGENSFIELPVLV